MRLFSPVPITLGGMLGFLVLLAYATLRSVGTGVVAANLQLPLLVIVTLCGGLAVSRLVFNTWLRDTGVLTLLIPVAIVSLLAHVNLALEFSAYELELGRLLAVGEWGALLEAGPGILSAAFIALQVSLFDGLSYQIPLFINFGLHVANSVLVGLLISRLVGRAQGLTQVGSSCAVLFSIIALAGVPLTELSFQADLLSATCTMLALLFAWDYLLRRGLPRLTLVFLLSLAAPLVLDEGVLTPLLLAVFLCFGQLIQLEGKIRLFMKSYSRGFLIVVFCSAIATACSLFIANAFGNSLALPTQASFKQLFIFSEFGVVLRGFGYFPSLTTELIAGQLPLSLKGVVSPELYLAFVALLASSVPWILFSFGDKRHLGVSFFVFGTLFAFASSAGVLLPRFGSDILALASTPAAYLGCTSVLFIALPMLHHLFERSGEHRDPTDVRTIIGGVLVFSFCSVQLFIGFRLAEALG